VTRGPVANVGASVRQRLLNLARERGEPFDQILQYYAIEGFLACPTRAVDFHIRRADAAAPVPHTVDIECA